MEGQAERVALGEEVGARVQVGGYVVRGLGGEEGEEGEVRGGGWWGGERGVAGKPVGLGWWGRGAGEVVEGC